MLFLITIGRRGSPRLAFEAIAEDSCAVVAQHLGLVQPLERMEVVFVREVDRA
jgi:hypothetical protein